MALCPCAEWTQPLSDNLPLPLHIIPHYIPVQILPRGEEDAALGPFGEAVGEADVFFGLRPAGDEEDVDGDAVLLAEEPFPQRGGFGFGMRGVAEVEDGSFEVGGREAVGDEDDLAVGGGLDGEE